MNNKPASFLEYQIKEAFNYENGFYLTSNISRIRKIISHYELYKQIMHLEEDIFEFGVFKGVSLIKWGTFREIFEKSSSRKIYGFDIFDKFPETNFDKDKILREQFIKDAGEMSITLEELQEVFKFKKFQNIELIRGDILNTVPDFIKLNEKIKIALLHIDVDIYEPSKIILENLYDKVVEGGIILLDDYGKFPGETKAVDDFFQDKKMKIKTLSFSESGPSYIIKE